MTGQKDLVTEYKEEKGPSVTFGGDGKGYTRGFGVLNNGTTTFRRVAYVDGLKHNLLSISQLCDKDYEGRFSKKACSMQNGVAERRNRTIIEAARSMLSDSHLPTQFWDEVFFILNNKDHLGKFDPKADDGIFLGYSSILKVYRVFNKRRQYVEETIHVTFDETRSANSKPIADNEDLNAWMFSHYRETEPFFLNHQHSNPPAADDDPNIIPPNAESNSWISAEPLNTLLPLDPSSSEHLSENNGLSDTQQLTADERKASSLVNIPIVDPTTDMSDHAPAQR
ncbi:hypothetical protein L6452_02041 [Arctium lappa]|uniref:Uncharacterized protein n=1 Tax=Arctium lappa TaxID=4217 RepID=A0ACB9FJ01_ARCLA|nr:hypothetical protein L6452_02041 [Arctium lappa]